MRGDQLTGGTKDVNPQWLNCPTLTQSGADTTTTQEVNINLSKLPTSPNSAIVMEILKILLTTTPLPNIASVTEVLDQIVATVSTSTGGTTALAFNDSRVIAQLTQQQRGAFTAAGTYANTLPGVLEADLTDGAGHGMLVATDSIFLQCSSTTTGNSNVVSCKILYRFKKIGLTEYIGIVQQQQ